MRTWPSESQKSGNCIQVYKLTQPSDPLILGGPLILQCSIERHFLFCFLSGACILIVIILRILRVLIGRLLFYEFVAPKRISLKCSLHNTLIPNLVKPLMHILPKGADVRYRSLCSKLYRSFFFRVCHFPVGIL